MNHSKLFLEVTNFTYSEKTQTKADNNLSRDNIYWLSGSSKADVLVANERQLNAPRLELTKSTTKRRQLDFPVLKATYYVDRHNEAKHTRANRFQLMRKENAIDKYLEFDVIHQPKKIYDSPRSFPSVTICNLRPFSTRDIRKLRAAGVAPVDMYINGIQRMRSYVRAEHKGLLSTLWSLAAYLSNLPESLDVQNLGHSLDDIMQSCFVLYKTGSVTRGTECERLGYWTKTQDQVFHNCYTYTVFENRSDTTLNMEMVIYLDNLVEQTDCFDCQ
ncbi:uncharacterized protein DEA37_0000857, partial [Paragonimus westermani]